MRLIDADKLKAWIERQGDPANEPHYNTALADVYEYVGRMPTETPVAPEKLAVEDIMKACYAAETHASDRADAAFNADDNATGDAWAEASVRFGDIGDALARAIK